MPTVLGRKYAVDFTGIPEGMSREDYLIWKVYRTRYIPGHSDIYFNVRLGSGVDPGPSYSDSDRSYWVTMTQLRADVIYVDADKVTILELRDAAKADVVGRLLAYRMLLLEDDPFNKPIVMQVATNRSHRDVEALCSSVGIRYLVI